MPILSTVERVPMLWYSIQHCFSVVVMVQSEKSGSWGIEFVTGEFEILDPLFALGAVQYADLSRD
jgi:hypothetical protein